MRSSNPMCFGRDCRFRTPVSGVVCASFRRRVGRVLGAIADLGRRFRASFRRRLGVVRDVFWARLAN